MQVPEPGEGAAVVRARVFGPAAVAAAGAVLGRRRLGSAAPGSRPPLTRRALLAGTALVTAVHTRTRYTGVRTKLTDPRFAGWFLPFKPGGSLPNGSYHVPPCTPSVMGAAAKCSSLYHDQEQTPQNGRPPPPPPPPLDGWGILGEGSIPQPAPDNVNTWAVYQQTTPDTCIVRAPLRCELSRFRHTMKLAAGDR